MKGEGEGQRANVYAVYGEESDVAAFMVANEQGIAGKIEIPRIFPARGEDEGRIRGYVDGNLLILEPENAFLLARFQKQDVIQRLAEAARSVTGREFRVQVRERKPEERQTRSLDELKQFKEVHFK